MPALNLTTNVKIADPKQFALDFSKVGADTLSKPELYISVNVTYNEHLTFGGTFDPAFLLHVVSLDNISPALNEKYSKAFFDFFKKNLAVSEDRGYIIFDDPGRGFLGHHSTTFAEIFGGRKT
ncbi:putative tautomerase MIF [Lyophyllum shimeji]|uniref:L-dopachrome isomerase n=1 Tax=Lyophyllum shimeji TaxID=47721 RepID=A0A9P3UJ93_LYOSH|nr:putative tautomerase MIF [Lyophyllum shimeji]